MREKPKKIYRFVSVKNGRKGRRRKSRGIILLHTGGGCMYTQSCWRRRAERRLFVQDIAVRRVYGNSKLAEKKGRIKGLNNNKKKKDDKRRTKNREKKEKTTLNVYCVLI